MDFVKPEEIDSEAWKDDNGDGEPAVVVDFAGEQMEIAAAVELAGEMLDRPEAFGLVKASRVRELARENEELRETVEELRGDMATLWEAVSVEAVDGKKAVEAGGSAFAPSSVDVYDPMGEFE